MSITQASGNVANKWDEAIEDAERKIAKLRFSIRVFQARKMAGDSFPLDTQLNLRTGKQQHAI
jgi:hypothetical protein